MANITNGYCYYTPKTARSEPRPLFSTVRATKEQAIHAGLLIGTQKELEELGYTIRPITIEPL